MKTVFHLLAICILFGLRFIVAAIALAGEIESPPALSAYSQAPEKSVSLREAIRLALAGNHSLKAASYNLAAKNEEIGIAGAALLPRISVEERFLRTDNPTYGFMAKLNQQRFSSGDFAIDSLNHPAAINDYQTSLGMEMMLFAPKARISHEMSKVEFAAAGQRLARRQEEIAADVARAYSMVLTAGQFVVAAEKAREDAREHQRVAQLRYDNGLGLYSDNLRAATAVHEAEQQLISARKNQAVARMGLGLLLGLAEPVEAQFGSLDISARQIDYYRQAAGGRKDLKALAEERRNAENNLKLARAGLLPILGAGTSYQLNDHRWPAGSEGDSWQISGFLKWELFDGNKRRHEASRACQQLAEIEEQLKAMEQAVLFKVNEAYLTVEEGARKLDLARSARQSAEEGARLVAVRYENSLAPLVDLLDAQLSLDRARAAGVAAENDMQMAIINLGFESGTILNDLQIETRGPEEVDK